MCIREGAGKILASTSHRSNTHPPVLLHVHKVLAGRAFVLTSDEIAAKEAQLAAESHAAAVK